MELDTFEGWNAYRYEILRLYAFSIFNVFVFRSVVVNSPHAPTPAPNPPSPPLQLFFLSHSHTFYCLAYIQLSFVLCLAARSHITFVLHFPNISLYISISAAVRSWCCDVQIWVILKVSSSSYPASWTPIPNYKMAGSISINSSISIYNTKHYHVW